MADTPEAATPAPAEATVATPQTTNEEPKAPEQKTEAPDMHGFSPEDLAGMRRFIDNNGGWDAIKAKISTPKSSQVAEPTPEAKTEALTSPQAAQPVEESIPDGAVSKEEVELRRYFNDFAREEKYAPIADIIKSGEVLKEMASFGISPTLPNGYYNDKQIRKYLDLKAQTVPAQPTSVEPNMSNAPTVEYISVGDKFTDMAQAQAVFMQKGHPMHQAAADYIKATLAGKDPYAQPVDKK